MARRNPCRGRLIPAAAFFAAVAFFASAAASYGGGAVGVDIGVVLASTEGSSVDPSLASLRGKLSSMFNYSSYRMLDRQRKTLEVGQTGEFGLPGGRSIRVTPAPPSGAKMRLAVQLMEGQKNLLTTTLGLSRGGMVLVGGPRYQSGVLILLISAE